MKYGADTAGPVHTLPTAGVAIENHNALRTNLFFCFQTRRRALVNIVDTVCVFPGPGDCVAHLSLASPDGLNYGTLYAGLNNAKICKDSLTVVSTYIVPEK